MNSAGLPRVKNNAPNRGLFGGYLKSIIGVLLLVVSAGLMIIKGVLSFAADTSDMVYAIWPIIVFAVWLICKGYDEIVLTGHYRRLSLYLVQGTPTIEQLSELMGDSVEGLTDKISKMNQRGYFGCMVMGERTIRFVTDKYIMPNSREYEVNASVGMRFIEKIKHSEVNQVFVAAVLFAIIFMVELPFYKIIWVLLALVLSFPLKKFFGLFTPQRMFIKYEQIPQYQPQQIKLHLSGNEGADELIKMAHKYILDLQDLDIKITDETLKVDITQLSVGLEQMLKILKDSPEKFRTVQQTLDYSVPTALKLYYKFVELESYQVKGENIEKAIAKIYEMSGVIKETFKKELDNMYQDQTLNIEVDVDVMRSILQQESIMLTSIIDDIENKK